MCAAHAILTGAHVVLGCLAKTQNTFDPSSAFVGARPWIHKIQLFGRHVQHKGKGYPNVNRKVDKHGSCMNQLPSPRKGRDDSPLMQQHRRQADLLPMQLPSHSQRAAGEPVR